MKEDLHFCSQQQKKEKKTSVPMSLPYQAEMKSVKQWKETAPVEGEPERPPPIVAFPVSTRNPDHQHQQQQQRSHSSAARSTSSLSNTGGGGGDDDTTNNNNDSSSQKRSQQKQQQNEPQEKLRRNNIALRTGPVVVPKHPFAPTPYKPPKLQLSSGTEKIQPRFLQGLDSIAEQGSARRERIASVRQSKAKAASCTSAGGIGWKSTKRTNSFFGSVVRNCDPLTKEEEEKLHVKKDAEEREAMIARLTRVVEKRITLPPLCPDIHLSEEEETEMVDRLFAGFEPRDEEEEEAYILEDDELDDLIDRLYEKPMEKMIAKREARGY